MKTSLLITLLLAVCAYGQKASAQGFTMDWSTLDGGAGTCAGGGFTVSGTIGQPDVGTLRNGHYTVIGGFWTVHGSNNSGSDSDSYLVVDVAPLPGPSPAVKVGWIGSPERQYRIWMRDSLNPNSPWVDSGFGVIQPVSGVGPSPMRAEFGVGPSPMYRLFGVGPSPLVISGVGPSPMRIFRIEVILPTAGR